MIDLDLPLGYRCYDRQNRAFAPERSDWLSDVLAFRPACRSLRLSAFPTRPLLAVQFPILPFSIHKVFQRTCIFRN